MKGCIALNIEEYLNKIFQKHIFKKNKYHQLQMLGTGVKITSFSIFLRFVFQKYVIVKYEQILNTLVSWNYVSKKLLFLVSRYFNIIFVI